MPYYALRKKEAVMLTQQLKDVKSQRVKTAMWVRTSLRGIGEDDPGGIIHHDVNLVPFNT